MTFFLTIDEDAWVVTYTVSPELMVYAEENFDAMFALRPVDRSCEIYLRTPICDVALDASCLLSGLGVSTGVATPLPSLFQPFLDYFEEYNQVTVNWFDDGHDFVDFHTEYDEGRDRRVPVVSLSLDGFATPPRTFTLKAKTSTDDAVVTKLALSLDSGRCVAMGGEAQAKFTCGVKKTTAHPYRRISVTFRKYF